MKLVNVVQRKRYKNDLCRQRIELAPDLAGLDDVAGTLDRLISIGAITLEEKTYFETVQQAKKICLDIEEMFSDKGHDVMANICLIDSTKKRPGLFGKLTFLCGPNLPDEYEELVDGIDFTPFTGICGKAAAKNRILQTTDVYNPKLFKHFFSFFQKYDIEFVMSCPIHIDGELCGTLAVFSREAMLVPETFLQTTRNYLIDQEELLAMIQEKWSNRDNVISWNYAIDSDGYVLAAEETVTDIFGYKPYEATGNNLFMDYVHLDDVKKALNDFQYVISNLKHKRSTHRIKHSDGHYIVTESLMSPCLEENVLKYIQVNISVKTSACVAYENELSQTELVK